MRYAQNTRNLAFGQTLELLNLNDRNDLYETYSIYSDCLIAKPEIVENLIFRCFVYKTDERISPFTLRKNYARCP